MTTTKHIYKVFKKHPSISTDSRKIEKGCIFFALKGETFNGNKFAESAIKQGASYAIIDEKEYQVSDKMILVDNVLKSLQELANHHRKQLATPVLAITGTNGKTTTKELTSAVLSQKFNVSFTEGNLNNHIGVPLTLLKMNTSTEFGVVEMGANHPGEIAELCKIAEPDFGLITNVGKAHLEGFGSFEGVIQTKSEMYRHLKKSNGHIFYNADNPILSDLLKDTKNKISYGTLNADLRGELLNSPPFVHLKVNFPKGVLYLNTNLTGDYNFENILAAACIGNYFQVDPIAIQSAIKNYFPKNNRSQLIKKDHLKIIMDAYNANPTSMQASINSFISNASENSYLILGDMLELGKYSNAEHTAILEILRKNTFVNVFTVGKIFNKISAGFNCKSFQNVNELYDYLQSNPIEKGKILIKGSRGIQLEKLLDLF